MSKKRYTKRHQLMVRWSVATLFVAFVIAIVVVWKNTRIDPMARNEDGTVTGLTSVLERVIEPDMVTFRFVEVAESVGLQFSHFNDNRSSLLPEDMGSGLAWGDYDNDGDDDLFVVNFGGNILKRAPVGNCALFQNNGDGTFIEVSSEAGVDIALYGMGATWADYDDDGDLDLYITAYGPNILLRNDDLHFTDVSFVAGVQDERFSAGATWADYDGDGDLDLYVTNYVAFTYQEADKKSAQRQYGAEVPFTLNPSSYPSQTNSLYRNNGDGTFTDVAELAGVQNPGGRSLGASWFDFEGDGNLDLYVANDVSSNGVFRNNGDGTFEDIGAISLAADYRGAMGLSVGDVDLDGDSDLLVTHWVAQENAFFENMLGEWGEENRISFMDTADQHGLGHISLHMVGWATGFVDLDNDGLLDLWVVNGHTLEEENDVLQLRRQNMQLFHQISGEGFFEIGKESCDELADPFVGRGGAHADYDQDGDMDIVVMSFGEGLRLLKNTSPHLGHWIRIHLTQPFPNSRAVGAKVTVRTGETIQFRQTGIDGSYLSQHQLDTQFGLGDVELVDEIIVLWPNGTTTIKTNIPVDQTFSIAR